MSGAAVVRLSGAAFLACAGLLALPSAAWAADNPVIARGAGVSVTVSGLRGLLATLPPETRSKIAADPASLTELLRTTVLQDELLAAAHAKGWDRQPDIVAQANRARDETIVRTYVDSQLPPAAPPSEAAIAAAYDANKPHFMLPRQFHLAQIFMAVPATATPAQSEQVRTQLVTLRAQCAGKPDAFAAAAKRLSTDAHSASAGGDLGWLREDRLAEPVRSAMLGLQEGSISDPLRTSDGWHLIELIATRPAGPAPLDQARPALEKALTEQQRQAEARAYLDKVLRDSKIEVNQDQLARFAQSGAAR